MKRYILIKGNRKTVLYKGKPTLMTLQYHFSIENTSVLEHRIFLPNSFMLINSPDNILYKKIYEYNN